LIKRELGGDLKKRKGWGMDLKNKEGAIDGFEKQTGN
jgi:hypothetical protein